VAINALAMSLFYKSTPPPRHLFSIATRSFGLQELCGTYQSAKHDSFLISRENETLHLRRGHNPSLSHGSNNQALVIEKDANQRWLVRNGPPNFSIGFFSDPTTLLPCLMFGLKSYRQME
jgi:hypothetical protein